MTGAMWSLWERVEWRLRWLAVQVEGWSLIAALTVLNLLLLAAFPLTLPVVLVNPRAAAAMAKRLEAWEMERLSVIDDHEASLYCDCDGPCHCDDAEDRPC